MDGVKPHIPRLGQRVEKQDFSNVWRRFQTAKDLATESGKDGESLQLTIHVHGFKFKTPGPQSGFYKRAIFFFVWIPESTYSVKGDWQYVGAINSEGTCERIKCDAWQIKLTPDMEHKLQQLAEMSDEMWKTEAIKFGKTTGYCSCCGRLLTNPESIDAGIGPICAERWGF